MKETKQCLKDLIVFQNLDPEELELLCQNSYAKLYKKDEIIFFENDSVKKTIFISKR